MQGRFTLSERGGAEDLSTPPPGARQKWARPARQDWARPGAEGGGAVASGAEGRLQCPEGAGVVVVVADISERDENPGGLGAEPPRASDCCARVKGLSRRRRRLARAVLEAARGASVVPGPQASRLRSRVASQQSPLWCGPPGVRTYFGRKWEGVLDGGQPCCGRKLGPSIFTVWQRSRRRLRSASTSGLLPRKPCHSS